jgi:UDP-N-acetylmuramate--alanine ligase
LLDDFAAVLADVDTLVLTEVYSAGEKPIPGADGRSLARAIRARGKADPVFVADPLTLPEVLKGVLKGNDVLLTMGAGNIGAVAATLPKILADGKS